MLLLIAGVVQLIMGVIVVVQLIMLLNEVHIWNALCVHIRCVCASHVHGTCHMHMHVHM